jgi:hypothetical protein
MRTKKAEYSGWVEAGGQVVAKAGDEVLPALKISRTLVSRARWGRDGEWGHLPGPTRTPPTVPFLRAITIIPNDTPSHPVCKFTHRAHHAHPAHGVGLGILIPERSLSWLPCGRGTEISAQSSTTLLRQEIHINFIPNLKLYDDNA